MLVLETWDQIGKMVIWWMKYISVFKIKLLSFISNPYSHNISLSTQDKLNLELPCIQTKVTLRDRAFICAARTLWNNLPLKIRKASLLMSSKFCWRCPCFQKLLNICVFCVRKIALREICFHHSSVDYIMFVTHAKETDEH